MSREPAGAEHDARVYRCIIAQCTDDKRDGTHKAKELYMPSRLFKAQRRYSEAFADMWIIVSGKYGLVRPETEIKSYNVPIDDDSWSEATQEAVDEFFRRSKADGLRIMHPDEDRVGLVGPNKSIHFELLCGEDYLKRLTPYLDHHDLDYSVPFEGQGYGTRTKSMKEAAREAENHSLEAYV